MTSDECSTEYRRQKPPDMPLSIGDLDAIGWFVQNRLDWSGRPAMRANREVMELIYWATAETYGANPSTPITRQMLAGRIAQLRGKFRDPDALELLTIAAKHVHDYQPKPSREGTQP